jgi:formate dehydrogenase subunit gamma
MTTGSSPRLVQRYLPAQRAIHWVGVGCFALLLLSGGTLMVRPLAWFAAGGLAGWVHRIAAVPFLFLPLAYALLLPQQTRELVSESVAFDRDDWCWLGRMPGYLLGRTHGLPPQGRLNAGQKLHHAATFLMFATVSLSGLTLWLAKGHLGPSGLAMAAMAHDLSMLGLSVLMIGHVYFTFLYDALSAMRSGYVTEDYARSEHRRWLDGLPPGAFAGSPRDSKPDAPQG